MSDVIPNQRTADPSTYLDEELLLQLLTVTWASFVDPECDLLPLGPAAPDELVVVAEVAIVGEAPIRILLSVDVAGAAFATELMLGPGAFGEVTGADVDDAIGELVNVLGGNIKSLLPEGSKLTLPTVLTGTYDADESGAGSDVVMVVGWGPHTVTARITGDVAELPGRVSPALSGATR